MKVPLPPAGFNVKPGDFFTVFCAYAFASASTPVRTDEKA
jgi:hypothetical protein